MASLVLVGCTRQPAPAGPDPAAILQAIPPADSAKYEHVQDMKNWRNPFLIVQANGVELYDAAEETERMLKPEELLSALAKLPSSKWPYGRVVAVRQAGGLGSEADKIAIRRNKGIVGGVLKSANIEVDWVSEVL
jgi:hypothetical protein